MLCGSQFAVFCASTPAPQTSGDSGRAAAMRKVAAWDWTNGISRQLRVLLDSGASNDDLDLYIQARRGGRTEAAQPLLSSTTREPTSGARAGPCGGDDQALMNLRVAALRPVVNRLSSHDLLRYIHFVHLASQLLVEARGDDPFWRSESAIAAAATSLTQSALESLKEAR